jgi:Ca2+-binding EF-hand superfamily protein
MGRSSSFIFRRIDLSIRFFAALAFAGVAAPALAAQSGGASAQASDLALRTDVQKNVDANFARLDTDSNGQLTKAEVDAAQARTRQQAAAAIATRLEQEFAKIDTNKDGRLTLAEFKAAAPSPRMADSDTALQRLDANRDGKITAEEFRAPILARFDQVDTNRDGRVTAEERAKVRPAAPGR